MDDPQSSLLHSMAHVLSVNKESICFMSPWLQESLAIHLLSISTSCCVRDDWSRLTLLVLLLFLFALKSSLKFLKVLSSSCSSGPMSHDLHTHSLVSGLWDQYNIWLTKGSLTRSHHMHNNNIIAACEGMLVL